MHPEHLLAPLLLLAATALAAPVSRTTMQSQILTLEVQILTVINSIAQSSSTLKTDYNNGIVQYGVLVNELQGPQPCAPFVPTRPTTRKRAIEALQISQESLMDLSLDLQNPDLKIKKGDFHGDVCVALDWYSAVSKFVGV